MVSTLPWNSIDTGLIPAQGATFSMFTTLMAVGIQAKGLYKCVSYSEIYTNVCCITRSTRYVSYSKISTNVCHIQRSTKICVLFKDLHKYDITLDFCSDAKLQQPPSLRRDMQTNELFFQNALSANPKIDVSMLTSSSEIIFCKRALNG